jgi:general secretion pathway protein E/type IV pilus assembly protein PilB
MAGNVIGMIAQRLVRRLCPHCKRPREAEDHELRLLGLPEGSIAQMYGPVGCDQCDFQGYRGRQAIMELVRMDADLDELVARRATLRELRACALAKGSRTLAEDGLRCVGEGFTSLEEVARVVDLTERMI